MSTSDQIDANAALQVLLEHRSTPSLEHDTEDDDEGEVKTPSATVRVFDCPVGPHPLKDAIVLPCGQCVCRTCLPPTFTREGIEKTWPGTPDRVQALLCPCCDKEHPKAECWPVYLANNAIDTINMLLEGLKLPGLEDGQRLMKMLEARNPHDTTSDNVLLEKTASVFRQIIDDIDSTLRPVMDCPICQMLLYRPWTTPCGHTFCQHCIARSGAINASCPTCRDQMPPQALNPRNKSPNGFITRVTEYFWSPDLAQRQEHVLVDSPYPPAEGGLNVPVFVCAVAYPAMPMLLHVFEPRYREMIRRVYDDGNGGKHFGMLQGGLGTGVGAIGVHLHITELTMLEDGRSLIETVGVSRFRIRQQGQHRDGYMVAEVEDFDDLSMVEEESLELAELNRFQGDLPTDFVPEAYEHLDLMSTTELMEFAYSMIVQFHSETASWLSSRIITIYGACPQDPALFPWWLGSIMPVTEPERARLLGQNTVRKRMKTCCEWIIDWNARYRRRSW